MKRVVDTCKKHNVVVGHPHVESGNCERIVKEGYRFLMCAPAQNCRRTSGAETVGRSSPRPAQPGLRIRGRVH
jgi:4-hydroxy-2-oxoheptanedioate aldolase